MLDELHPISQALEDSFISVDLKREFSVFISQYPDYELQALYLLNDKNISIEEIVSDLYGVKEDEQLNWLKKDDISLTESSQVLKEETRSSPNYTVNDRLLFRDWKQEHGFEVVPLELSDLHTLIYVERYTMKNKEEKFLWKFVRARYGKKGWGMKKIISPFNQVLDNNSSPGWIIRTVLEDNPLLCDPKTEEYAPSGKIPNPFILDSYNTHCLFFLLIGHPYFFHGELDITIKNTYKTLNFHLVYYKQKFDVLVVGRLAFLHKNNRKEFIDVELYKEISFFEGGPRGLLIRNKYYKLENISLSIPMIKEAFEGVTVPHNDWDDFRTHWKIFYPHISIEKSTEDDIPTYLLFTNKRKWMYWIEKFKEQKQLFNSEKDIVKIYISQQTNVYNCNRIGIKVDNFPKNIKKLKEHTSKKIHNLLDFLVYIKECQKQGSYYLVERGMASQLLSLLEYYPYCYSYNGQPLFSDKNNLEYELDVKRNKENSEQYILSGNIFYRDKNNQKISCLDSTQNVRKAIGFIPSYLLYKHQLYRLKYYLNGRIINDTLVNILVEESEIGIFYLAAIQQFKQRGITIIDTEGLLKISSLYNYTLHTQMYIDEVKGILVGEIKVFMKTGIGDFEYDIFASSDEFIKRINNRKYHISRNRKLERELFEEIMEHGWVTEEDDTYSMSPESSTYFVLNILPEYQEDSNKKITYYGQKKLVRWQAHKITPSLQTSISTGIDWFELNISIKYGDYTFKMEEIIELWKTGKNTVSIKNDRGIVVIDKEWMEKYVPIFNRLDNSHKRLQEKNILQHGSDENNYLIEKFHFGLIREIADKSDTIETDRTWEHMIQQLKADKEMERYEIPSTVLGELRPYQKDGVDWLSFLRKYRFGGILADDMGLGKTLQVLAYLSIHRKPHHNPNLVIAPTSVISNWEKEVKKFVPHFSIALYYGSKRYLIEEKFKEIDIIVTSYSVLQKSIETLQKYSFNTLILDEAQMIKNIHSKTSQLVQTLTAKHRITLTGTPIENSITELWSQFNFLMPGFMGKSRNFYKLYAMPVNKKNEKRQISKNLLKKQIQPFILRRIKQNVARELPPKTEQILYCEMGKDQRKLYNDILLLERNMLLDKYEKRGISGIKISLFSALLRLRQICCDPRLGKFNLPSTPESGKLKLFMQTILSVVQEGHRVLVFSQFVKMLDLIATDIKKHNIPFLRLDGGTKNRTEVVDKFQQSDEYPVFLISLKAGGVGINLTSADYVIHYEPWWNPAVEAQATDRVYRIGQTSQVFVYKMIVSNSIEEKMLELQQQKQDLAEKIIGNNDLIRNFGDIEKLFFNIDKNESDYS